MATYEYTAPDGNVYEFDGEEGFDDEEVKKEGARLFSELNNESSTGSTTVTYEYEAPDGNVYEFDGQEGFMMKKLRKKALGYFLLCKVELKGLLKGYHNTF